MVSVRRARLRRPSRARARAAHRPAAPAAARRATPRAARRPSNTCGRELHRSGKPRLGGASFWPIPGNDVTDDSDPRPAASPSLGDRRRRRRGRGRAARSVREIIRRFWPYARPYRRWLWVTAVFIVVMPAIETATIWLFKV